MLIELSNKRKESAKDLVGLLEDCHARIRYFIQLAYQAAVRTDVPPEELRQVCADVERYFIEALPLHIADEEESIAPRLHGLSPEVDDALQQMAQEHRGHSPTLAALLRASRVVREGPKNPEARNELAKTALRLQREFEEHLAFEESVLFPVVRTLIAQDARNLILQELRERRQPRGTT